MRKYFTSVVPDYTLATPRSALARYGTAVGSVAVMTLLAFWWKPFSSAGPFFFVCLPVLLTAWLGCFRAGLLASALSALAGNYILLGQFRFKYDPANLVRTVAFFAICAAISALADSARKGLRARQQLGKDIAEANRAKEALGKANAYNRSLIEASLDPLVTIGPDGKITDVNTATELVTGCERAALIGTDFSDYFTDPEKARAGYQRVFREGLVRDYPLVLRHRDGRTRSVLYNASVYPDEQGRVIGVFAAARDITEQKRAEEEIRRLNLDLERRVVERTAALDVVARKFSTMFDTTSDGVWLHNLEGRILEVNDAYCRMSGYSREELAGMPVSRLEARESSEEVAQHIRKVLEKGGHDRFESCHRRKDGSVFDVDITALYLDIDGGRIAIFVRDITERKRVEAELSESRKKYQTLIETIGDFVWEMDALGRYTYCSPQMEKLWGLKPEEMIGKTPFELMPAEHRQAAEESFLKMTRFPRPFSALESPSCDGYGRLVYIEIAGVPFFDGEGRLRGFRGISRDITERKRAEEALRQAEAAAQEATHRLQALMEAVPVGISFSDDVTCQRATGNPAVLEQFQLGPQDNLSASAPDLAAAGRRVRYLKAGREITEAELPLQRAVAENRVIPPMELTIELPSGRRWFCEASGAPVRDAAGKVLAGLAVTVDITARKMAEEALVRAEKLAAAGRMAAAVAHEVNNPLAALTNCVYLALMDTSLSEATRDYLRTAQQELMRIGYLTRQTLGFYRERSPAEPVPLGDMIDDVVRTYEPKLRDRKLNVTREIAVDTNVTTVAGELRQVLSNVVANGIDALPHGGILLLRARRISTSIGQAPLVMITVADNGAGIPAEVRGHIFEPFFTTKQDVGTGLGLWVARELLRKNGGSIRVRSRPGAGTVFSIFLPVAAAATASAG